MKLFAKILAIAVALALVFAVTFELWGEKLELLFSQQRCVEWFSESRSYAWAIAVGLLISDLVLPVPATGVMAALGAVYGLVPGAAVGAVGSALAGLLGYGLARLAGRRGIRYIASADEVERFRSMFDRWGGAAVIVSRVLPILPEVMCVLAGLARMSFARFVTALLLGTIPVALLFAALGGASRNQPWYGVLVAVLIPLLLWPIFLHIVRRVERASAAQREP
ncbi:MAG: VTT domain-containing protein [Planctomycetota bacterium]